MINPKSLRTNIPFDDSTQANEQREKIAEEIAEVHEDKRYLYYHYPRNAEEWWNNVYDWWPELMELFATYLPTTKHSTIHGEILTTPLHVHLEKLKHDKDKRLEDYFHATWSVAPDHGSIHAQKAWDVLCDLCSECYVLHDEDEEH